jgi:hypothetical protein
MCSRPNARSSKKNDGCGSTTDRTPVERTHLRPAFTVHPYKTPEDGSMKDLEAASINDVRRFLPHLLRAEQRHARAVGTSRPKEAQGPVTRYLGPCSEIIRRSRVTFHSRSRTDQGAPRQAGRVVAAPGGWLRTTFTFDGESGRRSPLHIASKVLSDGQSSRHLPEARVTRNRSRWPHSAAATSSRIQNSLSTPVAIRPTRSYAGGSDRWADRGARSARAMKPIRPQNCSRPRIRIRPRLYLQSRVEQRQKRCSSGPSARPSQRHQDR